MHHQGPVTVERLTARLRSFGLSISKRQVMRLLIDRRDDFLGESRDVLRAGLPSAAWISVDDTGARHAGRNGFCTQIDNDGFTWFGTRAGKSRLNFLDVLRAGHTDYVTNETALAYMHKRALAGPIRCGAACVVLGAGRTARAQSQSQGVSHRADRASRRRNAGPLRSHLPPPHRLRQPRPAARAVIPTALDIDCCSIAGADRANAVWVADKPVPGGLQTSIISS